MEPVFELEIERQRLTLLGEAQKLLKGDLVALKPDAITKMIGAFRPLKLSFFDLYQTLADQARSLDKDVSSDDRQERPFVCLYVVFRHRLAWYEEEKHQRGSLSGEEETIIVQLTRICQTIEEELLARPDSTGEDRKELVPRLAEWRDPDMVVTAASRDRYRTPLSRDFAPTGHNEDAYLMPGANPQWLPLCAQLEKDERLPGLSALIQEIFAEDSVLKRYLAQQERNLMPEAHVFGVFDGVGGSLFSELTAWISARILQIHAERWDELETQDEIRKAMRIAIHHTELVLKKLSERMKALEEARATSRGFVERNTERLITTACFGYEHRNWPGHIFGISIGDSEVYHFDDGSRELRLLTRNTPAFLGTTGGEGTTPMMTFECQLEPYDLFFCASDGLKKLYPLSELQRLCRKHADRNIPIPFSQWILQQSVLQESLLEVPKMEDGTSRVYGLDDVTVVQAARLDRED